MSVPTTYRRNVAIVVLNGEGQILVCERSDHADAWQLPQGGIDAGESEEQAMLRELEEEIGTAEVEEIGRLMVPIRYEWPEELYSRGFRGQEQSYFLVRLRPNAKLDLDKYPPKEFASVRWMGREEFYANLQGFKAEAYRRAIDQFDALMPNTIAE